ncbi:MAG TPA: hypothetical protein VJN71_01505 [Nitrososphaerales archaeon]|nr:hypothetical protein [Nitrososphaerales archaeon]
MKNGLSVIIFLILAASLFLLSFGTPVFCHGRCQPAQAIFQQPLVIVEVVLAIIFAALGIDFALRKPEKPSRKTEEIPSNE